MSQAVNTRSAALLDISALLEFSRLLNESGNPAVICNNLLFTLMGKLGMGRAAVALPADDRTFVVTYVKGLLGGLDGKEFRWDGPRLTGLYPVQGLEDQALRQVLDEAGIDRVMTVTFGDTLFALVLMGRLLRAVDDETEYTIYALLMGATAAMALDGCRTRDSLDKANRRLERRVHRLKSLVEASTEFSLLLDRDAILRLLGYTLMGEMAISRFAVLFKTQGGSYEPAINRFNELPNQALLEYCALQAPWLIARNTLDATSVQESAIFDMGVHAALTVSAQDEADGLLLVGERLYQSFDEEDVEYIALLANLAAATLENARLMGERLEKQRMEDELQIAAQIQEGLLPKTLPRLHGFDLNARTIPSRQIGGDCYDAIDLGNNRVLISIADVVGKGTPAALLMANMQAALRALARLELPLTDIVIRINDVIYENTAPDKFITGFFCIIDTELRQIGYVNAGHNPPYLFPAAGGAPEQLDCGGLILGVMPGELISYEVGHVDMHPGDLLVLYTDGVTEALDLKRREYGTERLHALFTEKYSVVSARHALELLRHDIVKFVGEAPQSDDITILTLFCTRETVTDS